ncbi:hypothetical protein IKN40_09170 [bacterium]|nr:hypothetical protein [bacterium]
MNELNDLVLKGIIFQQKLSGKLLLTYGKTIILKWLNNECEKNLVKIYYYQLYEQDKKLHGVLNEIKNYENLIKHIIGFQHLIVSQYEQLENEILIFIYHLILNQFFDEVELLKYEVHMLTEILKLLFVVFNENLR